MFKPIVLPGVAVSMVCAAMAQQNASEPVTIIATGIGESAQVSPAIPEVERRPALSKAWQLLGRMAQRKPDGTAYSMYRYNDMETWVEWKNLRVEAMCEADIDESDWMNGITRRFLCLVAADAHRVWLPDRLRWESWHPGDYLAFPKIIEVVWSNGGWEARSVHAGEFIAPGGGGSSSLGKGIVRLGKPAPRHDVAMGR